MVLSKASVFVTNGGYNGVQQALSFGVPVVSAASTEDKPYVSARVAWSGVGIDLKTGTPIAEQLRDAVRQVLHDPAYRVRAKVLGASIAKKDALVTIAEIVEAAIAKTAVHKSPSERVAQC
jgi:UDP:flavonoid glycosyltransferase YjiC (YdhE family)